MADEALERIKAAARKPAGKNKAGHSELYEWYRSRYDELAPSLLPPNTPNWAEIAAGFAVLLAQGESVRGGDGKAPSPATCRKTFVKVGEDKRRVAVDPPLKRKPRGKSARAASVHAAVPEAVVPSRSVPAVPSAATDHSVDGDEDEIVPRYAGGPKKWTQSPGGSKDG